jgi:hypothetical protein
MIFNMFCGGGSGSADLNFSVEKYASVDVLPQTAEANTIAIITATEISSWLLSDTTPETLEPGVVWIGMNTSSNFNFNALKENGINIHLGAAKQCIDNSFVSMNAYIYQDGWMQFSADFDGYLFNNGSVNEDITGGWTGDATITTIGDTLFGDYYAAQSTYGAMCRTVNMIDLTDYSAIKVNCTKLAGLARLYIDQGSDVVKYEFIQTTGVTSLDVSGITGEYYIKIDLSGNSNGDYTINQVWLE